MTTEKTILAVLTRYKERKIPRGRAAALLAVSEREVTRLMRERKLTRDVAPYKLRKKETEKKRDTRIDAARSAKTNRISVKQAAKRAGCSERTIRRYMEQV